MVLDCPHCGSEKTGFEFSGEAYVTKRHLWHHLYVCRKCWEAIVVTLANREGMQYPTDRHPKDCSGDPVDEGYEIVCVYPRRPKTDAPDHVPSEIAQDYKEAMDSLRRQNWTSAGVMFRKALQRATSAICPDSVNFRNEPLAKRIDVLAGHHKLTPAMKDLAHLIRVEGNTAVHGEEEVFTEEEASQMQEFSALFLIYTFTLPERVRQAREEVQAAS